MAWWRRPNASLNNIGEAAAAGLPPSFDYYYDEVTEATAVPEVVEVIPETTSPASALDLWMQATNNKMSCGYFTKVDDKLHFTKDVASPCQFWSEGVLATTVAIFGLIGNLVSIWVLSVPEMRCNAFNRLLLALAIIDCLFIGPGMLIYSFKAFELHAEWYNYLFPWVLYPASEIALCSSIYMTVAIAVERYIGLCRPFRRLTSRPCPAKAYILPVLALSLLLNIPKFLEAEIIHGRDVSNPNVTITSIGITKLRTHPHYITYYTMWTRLLATGVAPLALLAILNTKIYLALRRSKAQLRSMAIRAALPMAILGKPATPPSQIDLRIDATAASALMGGGAATSTASTGVNGDTPPTAKNGHAHLKRNESSSCTQTPIHNGGHAHISNGGGSVVSSPSPAGGRHQKPHPMNRSVSAAVVQRRPRELISRSHSTAVTTAARQPLSGGGGAVNAAPPSNNNNNNSNNSDLNLAPILFGVVIVFVLCNTLRVLLNMYDFSVVDEIIDCEKKGVGRMPPAWIMCSISVSHFLLMVNSSVNFLVYCVAGSKFRTILWQQMSSLFKFRFFRSKLLRTATSSRDPRGVAENGRGMGPDVALLPGSMHRRSTKILQQPRIPKTNENGGCVV